MKKGSFRILKFTKNLAPFLACTRRVVLDEVSKYAPHKKMRSITGSLETVKIALVSGR